MSDSTLQQAEGGRPQPIPVQVPLQNLPPEAARQLAAQLNQQLASQSPVHYVSFSAEVVAQTIESLLALCADLVNKFRPQTIYLILNTPGGQVSYGINAYNVLRSLPVKLITHNAGAVDSIGNVIFLAGEERYACKNSSFMFHGVGFDIAGQNLRLETKLLQERMALISADEGKIASIITERTKMSEEEVRKSFLEQKTRDPDFARTNGIVHDIREIKIPAGAPIHQLVFQRQGVVVR